MNADKQRASALLKDCCDAKSSCSTVTDALSVPDISPLEHAESKVHESFMLWQFAKTPTEQREAGDSLTRAIKERNALRTPEQVAEIEAAKGLR